MLELEESLARRTSDCFPLRETLRIEAQVLSLCLEFYALVQSLRHWRHYLVGREFVLYSDHESLKHLHSQQKAGANYSKWSTYIQEFNFTRRHKYGKENVIADALSLWKHLPTTMAVFVPGFKQI